MCTDFRVGLNLDTRKTEVLKVQAPDEVKRAI